MPRLGHLYHTTASPAFLFLFIIELGVHDLLYLLSWIKVSTRFSSLETAASIYPSTFVFHLLLVRWILLGGPFGIYTQCRSFTIQLGRAYSDEVIISYGM